MMHLAKSFVIYGIGGAASRLAAIILVPLYTRALSIDAYGQLEVLLALHAAAVLLVGLQSESAVARDYFEARKGTDLARLTWGSVVITLAGTIALFLLVALAAAAGWLPPSVAPYVPWLFLMTVPAQLLGVQLVLMRFAGRPLFFAILSFLDLALGALFSAALIIGFGLGVTGALAGLAASKTLCMLIAWPTTFGPPTTWPGAAMMRRMLAYSLPTMPAVMLNWLQTTGNRVLLAFFLTLSDVALAGLAIKVAAIYGFLAYAFRLVWEPYSFERLESLDADPLVYNRALHLYLFIMFFIAGLATLASPIIVSVLAPSAYGSATLLAGFFILGQFWVGAIPILCIGIHGARVTSRLSYVYALGALVNLLALAVLSAWIGVLGAAIGFLLGAVASALLATYYSEKHFRTGFDPRLIAMALLATGLFAICAFLLHSLGAPPGAALPRQAIAYSGAFIILIATTLLIGRPRLTQREGAELPPKFAAALLRLRLSK